MENDSLAHTASADGGEGIVIRGQNISLMLSQILAGILLNAGMETSKTGEILLDASQDITLSQGSVIGNFVGEDARGQGSDIVIRAENLTYYQD